MTRLGDQQARSMCIDHLLAIPPKGSDGGGRASAVLYLSIGCTFYTAWVASICTKPTPTGGNPTVRIGNWRRFTTADGWRSGCTRS